MKTKLVFLAMFAMIALTVNAQSEYDVYLQKARQRLAEGDCEGARKNYNVYKELTQKTDKSLERGIAECGPDAPLSLDELKSAGFRFLKEYSRVKVVSRSDYQTVSIFNGGPYLVDNMACFGGQVSNSGLLNGVVILKSSGDRAYLAYICNGKVAFPMLEFGYYDGGYFMALQEGNSSYGCIFPSWNGNYRSEGLCESMREAYGMDFSDPEVLHGICNVNIDLGVLDAVFKSFVRGGNQLNDSWSDDPEYTDSYEGFEPVIEGYKSGEFDERLDQYRPINNGELLYSQTSEFYCDGVYDPYESRFQNGHGLHIPHTGFNPNHFRVIFSFKALSNQGWCQGHADGEQWPVLMDCGRLGVRLNEDGSITINTHGSDGKDHYYVTGYSYSVNRYVDIDMEYDHGQFIINGHRFTISVDLSITEFCDRGFHSVNYSIGNAFKGYIKDLRIYSFPE